MKSELEPDLEKSQVKIYQLNQEGNWSEYGVGDLKIKKVQNDLTEVEESFFFVYSEDLSQQTEPIGKKLEINKKAKFEENAIFIAKITQDFVYDRQQNNIITWVDSDLNEEFALSFLYQQATDEAWRLICNVVGRNIQIIKSIDQAELDVLVQPSMETLQIV